MERGALCSGPCGDGFYSIDDACLACPGAAGSLAALLALCLTPGALLFFALRRALCKGKGAAKPGGGDPLANWGFVTAARRSSAEHLIATKALRCTAPAWILTVAESFAKF